MYERSVFGLSPTWLYCLSSVRLTRLILLGGRVKGFSIIVENIIMNRQKVIFLIAQAIL